MSKVDLRLQCGMLCSKLEVSTAQHGTLSGAGYLHQSRMTIDEAALADHVRAGVAEPPARPREIVVIEEMPTTLVGKIFKPRLREIAAEEAAPELLSDALSGVAVVVAASHNACGLVLQARVPAHAVAAAREELGKLPVAFEIEASSPAAGA